MNLSSFFRNLFNCVYYNVSYVCSNEETESTEMDNDAWLDYTISELKRIQETDKDTTDLVLRLTRIQTKRDLQRIRDKLYAGSGNP